VVLPTFGRVKALRRILAALDGHDVLVVEDSTPRPDPIEEVAREAAATYLPCAYQPRNTGLRA